MRQPICELLPVDAIVALNLNDLFTVWPKFPRHVKCTLKSAYAASPSICGGPMSGGPATVKRDAASRILASSLSRPNALEG